MRVLLSGELLNIATIPDLGKVIEDATVLFDSIERPLIISRILEGVKTLKAKQSQRQLSLRADTKENGDGALDDFHLGNETREIPQPTLVPSGYSHDPFQPPPIVPSVLQILALNLPYSGFLVDLDCPICIEWRNYSRRGDPLWVSLLWWIRSYDLLLIETKYANNSNLG